MVKLKAHLLGIQIGVSCGVPQILPHHQKSLWGSTDLVGPCNFQSIVIIIHWHIHLYFWVSRLKKKQPELHYCFSPMIINYLWGNMVYPQIYKGDPRSCIMPYAMASSVKGLNLGIFGFVPTTHSKTKCKTNAFTLADCSRCKCCSTDEPWLFSLQNKAVDSQFWAHARRKIAQVLLPPFHICGFTRYHLIMTSYAIISICCTVVICRPSIRQ